MPVLASLVALLVLLAYLFTAGPTFYWLDSSELVASSFGLGVSHPPGHALHAVVTHLFCLLPVGSISFRVTLASASEAAAAAGVMVVLCHDVARRALGTLHRRAPWIAASSAVLGGLALGLSYAVWFQAVRAEVYALNLLIIVVGLALVVRWEERGDRRLLLLAALCCGLGLGNHHLLVLLALPAVGAFLLARRWGEGRARLLLGLVLSGASGLMVLIVLPLRAAQLPLVNWGFPVTWQRWLWVISAEAFRQRSMERAAVETLTHRGLGGLFSVFRGFAWESYLGLALGMMALVGLYVLWRRRCSWRLGLLLSLVVGLNLLSPVLVGLDPYNPDAYGYLCVALAALCPAVAVAVAATAVLLRHAGIRWLPRSLRLAVVGTGLLLLPLVLWQVRTNLPRVDLRAHWAAEESGRALVRQLPPGAVVLTSYFESVFNLWALRAVADLRPDLVYLHRNFLAYPGQVEQLVQSGHPLAADARRWRTAGQVLAPDLRRLARRRAVFVEQGLNLSSAVQRTLAPFGLLLRVAPLGPEDQQQHRARIDRWQRWVSAAGPLSDNETRRAMVWLHYQLARFSCARGLGALARYHLHHARELAPRDRTLVALERRCTAGR